MRLSPSTPPLKSPTTSECKMKRVLLFLLLFSSCLSHLCSAAQPEFVASITESTSFQKLCFASDANTLFHLNYNIPTECRLCATDIQREQTKRVNAGAFAIFPATAPRASILAVGDMHGNISFYDATYELSNRSMLTIGGKTQALALSADGRYVAAATESELLVYEIGSSACIFRRSISGGVMHIALSEDGQLLSSADRVHHTLYDTSTGNVKYTQNLPTQTSVFYSPNGTLMAIRGRQDVSIYPVAGGNLLFHLSTKSEKFNALEFSQDGQFFAYQSADGELGVIRSSGGTILCSGRVNKHFSELAFTPDNRTLYAAADKCVDFYDIASVTQSTGSAPTAVANTPMNDFQELGAILSELQQTRYSDATANLYRKRLLTLLPMLLNGANPNITTPETKGNTALHYACGLCNVRLVDWLLRHGANPNARTNKGATPMQCVTREVDGHSTYTEYYLIRNILMQYGAPPPNVPKWS